MASSLHELAQATIGSDGNAAFTFQPVPSGQVWTGSIAVPAAVSSSVLSIVWTAFDDGFPLGSWYDSQSSGTLQARGVVTVTASGVAAGGLVAYFSGISTDTASAPPWWPSPTPAPPPGRPKVIVSNNVSLSSGTTQIGSVQPVVVGTSMEIYECITFHQGAGSLVRLAIQWSVDGTFVDPIEYDFDLSDITQMRGLVLPNLAPFIQFLGKTLGGQEQISLTAFTGLAPIVRSPIVRGVTLAPAGGMLASSGGPFLAGATPFPLPPYVGAAMLSGEMIGAPNKFEISVTASDYLGNSSRSAFVVDSTADPNGVRIIPPTQIWIPPQICTLNVINGNGAQENGDFQLVAAGP